MLKYIKYFFIVSLFLPLSVFALTTFITTQGGTGTTSPSGILYGDNNATQHLNTVSMGSGLTFSGGTLSSTAANFSYPFPNNATSTTLIFNGGFLSTASTTFSNLGTGEVGSNNGKLYVYATTTPGTVTSITGGLGLLGGTITTSGTLQLASYVATSTAETDGQLAYWTTTAGTPAKLSTVATSSASCTGVAACSAFTVVGGVSPAINVPFSFTPSAAGNSTSTTLILTNGVIANASSTMSSTLAVNGIASLTGGFISIASSTINTTVFDISPSTVIQHSYPSLSIATSTVSSTTYLFYAPAVPKQTWVSSTCSFQAGQIVTVQFFNGANPLDFIMATGTSLVRTTFTTNNIFSSGSIMGMKASSSAPYIGGCTLDRILNQ